MKKMLLLLLVMLGFAANSFAVNVISADPYAAGGLDLTTNEAPAYYIWTDDEYRTDWSVRWVNNAEETYVFSGQIILYNNQFEAINVITFDDAAASLNTAQTAFTYQFATGDSTNADGLDFSISKIDAEAASYVGFLLSIVGEEGVLMNTNEFVYIGADYVNPETDACFAIQAPVPEPGTILLLGSGLVGLAFLKRRKQ